MVDDLSRPGDGHASARPAPEVSELVAVVYRVALECAGDPGERVRVTAGGTVDAAHWTFGARAIAPSSGRAVQEPTALQVVSEYVAALQEREDAETALGYARATGVVDWLALILGADPTGRDQARAGRLPGFDDRGVVPAWWQPVLDRLTDLSRSQPLSG